MKLASIAGFGVAARTLLMMTVTRHKVPAFDANYYQLWAKAIAQGHGFVDPLLFYIGHTPRPSALFPPGYSLLEAFFALLGAHTRQWDLFIGCCLGGLSVVLCGYLARHFLSNRASLVVAALAAVYPVLLGADTSGMSEALYLPLILATLLLAMKCTSRRAWPWALLGATIGLAALTRGEALVYLAVLVLPLAIYSGGHAPRKVALVGLTVMTAMVVLAPWAIRNEMTFGTPVLLANSSSTVIGGANCDATYHGPLLSSWVYGCTQAQRPGAAGMNEAELNDAIRQQGMSYAANHAGRVPLVLLVRVLRTYGFYAPRQQFRLSSSYEGRIYPLEEIGWFMNLGLLALAIIGVHAIARRRAGTRPQDLIALAAPLIAVTVVTMATYGNPRFRIAAEPVYLVVAVLGGTVITRYLRRIVDGPAMRLQVGITGGSPLSGAVEDLSRSPGRA